VVIDWKHHTVAWVVAVGGAFLLPGVSGFKGLLGLLLVAYAVLYGTAYLYEEGLPDRVTEHLS
jgi:hypothetical protein